MPSAEYQRNVFINCPFDAQYAPIFEALVFTVHAAGFRPTSARERLDSSEVRISKIVSLIGDSRFSIHDLSRTELDTESGLPRFNMPLELGIDLGCKSFSNVHKDKSFLIFESEQYQFQKYISDIAGQDIRDHQNEPRKAVERVRDWLRTESNRNNIPGASTIFAQYEGFRADLPAICETLRYDLIALTFVDFSFTVAFWLERSANHGPPN